jgi:hypothetical protein
MHNEAIFLGACSIAAALPHSGESAEARAAEAVKLATAVSQAMGKATEDEAARGPSHTAKDILRIADAVAERLDPDADMRGFRELLSALLLGVGYAPPAVQPVVEAVAKSKLPAAGRPIAKDPQG